jgi:hypothetical protein
VNSSALLGRLHQHQDGILAIMRGAEPLLADPALRDVAALARSRWALMRALTAYQLFKHGEIFDPAIARQVLGDNARAERLKHACLAIGEDFRGHVAKWSGSDVTGEWSSYQPAALAMIARLRAHVARERGEIEMLLQRMAA